MKFLCFTLLSLMLFSFCSGQTGTPQPLIPKGGTSDRNRAPGVYLHSINSVAVDKDADFRCGLQDKKGRLWFGTYRKGVYRYDGKKFINFMEKDGLGSNCVLSICEDRTGAIWFGTCTGVCRYDGRTFSNIPVSAAVNSYLIPPGSSANTTISNVRCLFQDKTGKIWAGAREGVFCYNGDLLTSFLDDSKVINKNGLRLRDVQSIFQDKSGNIWLASGGTGMGEDGICLFDGKTLTNFKPKGYGRGMRIIEDKNGNLLFSSGYAVFSYDGKTFTDLAKKAGLKLFAYDMLKDKTGTIWLTAENEKLETSLYRYDGASFVKFATKQGFDDHDVSCMVEDNARNIWFGTRKSGLYRYDGKTFAHFSRTTSE